MQEAWSAHQEALEELQIPKIHELKAMHPELERMANERVQKLLERDSEPLDPSSEGKAPFMYYEPAEGTGGLPAVICTCGQKKHHLRMKVLQIWANKHYNKTGHKPT